MGGEFGTAPAAARAAASLAGLLVRLFGTFRRKRSSTAAMDEAKGKLSGEVIGLEDFLMKFHDPQ